MSLVRTKTYTWRAYMSSGLTNVDDAYRENLTNSLENLYLNVFDPMGVLLYLPHLWSDPGHNSAMAPEDVHALDRRRISESHFVIVSADYPSFGVGQEFEIAQALGLPVLVYKHKSCRVSRMLSGGPAIRIVPGDPPLETSRGIILYERQTDLEESLRSRTHELLSTLESNVTDQDSQIVFGETLRMHLRTRNWSLQKLAQETGMSVAFVSMLLTSDSDLNQVLLRWELPDLGTKPNLARYVNPGLWVLHLISKVLDVPISELFELQHTAEYAQRDAALQYIRQKARRWSVEKGATERLPDLNGAISTWKTEEVLAARSLDDEELFLRFQAILGERDPN